MISLERWFPNLGRDPNEGRGGSDVWTREEFMENSIITIKISKLLSGFKQNDRKNFKHTVVRKGINTNTAPKSYLYFNALWHPKCLQIVLYDCKIHNLYMFESLWRSEH